MVNQHFQMLPKKAHERYQNLSEKKKTKSEKSSRKISKFYRRRKRKKVSVLSAT